MTTSSPLTVASEVIRLLERAASRDAKGRRPSSASADLWRAIRVLEDDLLGGRYGTRQLAYREPLDAEAMDRVDEALRCFLAHPLHYNCTPMCCNASQIRWHQITTVVLTLRVAAAWRPRLLVGVDAQTVRFWLQDTSTRIAPAAAAALAQVPTAAVEHWKPVADALVAHPQWQVRDSLLRAVARAEWPRPPLALREAVKRGDRPGDPRILREVWQRRALARLDSARQTDC